MNNHYGRTCSCGHKKRNHTYYYGCNKCGCPTFKKSKENKVKQDGK